MKISQALIFLPLALAIPAVHSPHDIEVSIKIKGTEISITDDDDYYSCLVKTYPPDYVDCPDGYDTVPIQGGKKSACCTKNHPDDDDDAVLARLEKAMSSPSSGKVSRTGL